jgi:general stress protein YciG
MAKRKNPAAVSLGKKGGLTRAKNLTPEERSESARKAGQASAVKRWGNRRNAE